MPKYKLTYFDVKGLGEGIRMILSYMEADWEEVRIERPQLPTSPWQKLKAGVKYHKLPVLEIDGKEVYQSSAICRYLASEAGLLGRNPWENLQIDIIEGTFKDFIVELQRAFGQQPEPWLDEAAKAERMRSVKEEAIPYYFKIYDDSVKGNNGYLAIGKLTWVDFYVIGFTETIEIATGEKIYEKYQNLNELKNRIYSIPSVKKWIDKRPESI
uniref:glutathione transferase n=1 Tax=Lygus hesperus TaxID=30085 RepID=A0A146M8G7_LYGHE